MLARLTPKLTPILILCALALAVLVDAAAAADLSERPSIGGIFAEPPIGRTVVVKRAPEYEITPWVNNSPWVPGYYGRPGDFYYENYYGTSPLLIWGRLPYACKFYGSC